MAHLTCVEHKKRVVVLPYKKLVFHRSDNSDCGTTMVRLGGADLDITVGEFCVLALEFSAMPRVRR